MFKCDCFLFQAVVALNLNMNFLIAILVCLAIILTAVIVLAVYRRKRHVFTYVCVYIILRFTRTRLAEIYLFLIVKRILTAIYVKISSTTRMKVAAREIRSVHFCLVIVAT